MSSRDEFKEAIASRAFVHSKNGVRIIENEGRITQWLFDFRAVLLEPAWLDTYAELFWEKHAERYPFQVCGMETAAIALVAAIVMKGVERGTPVNGLFVRKSRKRSGLMKQMEGTPTKDPVILVDDLINSGQTFEKQMKIIDESQLHVSSIFTILAFRDMSAYEFITKQQIGVSSLFTLKDFGMPLLSAHSPEIPSDSLELIWHFQAPSPSYNIVLQKSTPALDEKRLYFGSDAGVFYALNQSDGSIAWTFKVGKHPEGKGILSSPVVYKKIVYFGAYDGTVYALNTETGTLVWKYSDADWVGSSPALSPKLGLIFIGLEYGLWRKQGGVVALNCATGAVAWLDRTTHFTHGSPLYIEQENMVVVGSNDSTVYAYAADTGARMWQFRADGDTKASLSYDTKRHLVFFGTLAGTFYALSAQDGRAAFAKELVAGMYSTPLVLEQTVFIASLDKHVYAIDLDTGTERWSFATSGRIFASPTFADGSLWIGSNDGRLYELDQVSGKMKGFFQTTEKIVAPIQYDEEHGRYFVTTHGNEIYCLSRKH